MRPRKFKKTRFHTKVFLVICEGETEKKYIELLKDYYHLPITIKTKVSGNRINSSLVDKYLKELGFEDIKHEIFYIYDADVPFVADKLKGMEGTALLTNPCIELWFLLHVKEHTSHQNSDNIVHLLSNSHPAWQTYRKGVFTNEQKRILLDNKNAAAIRSKILDYPQNPSSNLYKFIEILDEASKCQNS